jgi:hypothetical protein
MSGQLSSDWRQTDYNRTLSFSVQQNIVGGLTDCSAFQGHRTTARPSQAVHDDP